MAGKLTLMEELKLRQKERDNSYKAEAKDEEESTPINKNSSNKPSLNNNTNTKKLPSNDARKAILSQFLARKQPNPKPSKAHKTSLSDIKGSTDRIGTVFNTHSYHNNNNNNNKNDINPTQNTPVIEHSHDSSSSFFSKDSNDDNHQRKHNLSTIKSGDEEEKYDALPTLNHNNNNNNNINEDTMSIYTDSTYYSTTASVQSINGRTRKKKKKKRKNINTNKARIIQQGNHITCNRTRKSSVSRSSDIPPLSYSQHTPPNSPPLSQHALDQHNQRS